MCDFRGIDRDFRVRYTVTILGCDSFVEVETTIPVTDDPRNCELPSRCEMHLCRSSKRPWGGGSEHNVP